MVLILCLFTGCKKEEKNTPTSMSGNIDEFTPKYN